MDRKIGVCTCQDLYAGVRGLTCPMLAPGMSTFASDGEGNWRSDSCSQCQDRWETMHGYQYPPSHGLLS